MVNFIFAFLIPILGRCWTLENSLPNQETTDSAFGILSDEVKTLKKALDQLIVRDRLKDIKFIEMEENLAILKSENTELKKRVTELELADSAMKENCTRLMQKCGEGRNRRNQIKSPVSRTKLFHQNNFTGESSNDPKVKSTKRLLHAGVNNTAPEGKVAFSAYYGDATRPLSKGQTIIFQGTYINIGNSYNKYTGVFTVKTAGVYVFFVHILCTPNESMIAAITRDGIKISYFSYHGTSAYEDGSTMAIMDLSVGMSVWARVHSVFNNDKDALAAETSFSGFLLYPN